MAATPGLSLVRRVPVRVWTVLSWAGLVLSPLVLYLWIALGGPFTVLPLLAMLLPFGALRRRPLVALGVLLAEAIAVELLPLPSPSASGLHQSIRYLQVVTVDLAVGCIAATRRPGVSVTAAVLALVVQLGVAATAELWPGDLETAVIPYVLAIVTVWAIGTMIGQRRRFREAQRAQAEFRAVQAERLRISREVHDMVAHSIGVIAFQAGMGSRVIDTQPSEARDALRAIEETSRDTLAGLRRMLGTLRRADVGPGTAPLDPAPGLADLDGLAARSLDAGVRVDVHRRGGRQPLSPDIDLSAFRIVQEAVTNVIRHAGVRRCEVVVDQRDKELFIEVTDDGQNSAEGTGYGIPGMRERATLLRGEFTAGRRPEGGFRVAARIPIPAGNR
ncbi:hypothetical protein BS329_40735 [Amycolatopsis coloradensis]|uniref:histidine kinase n=1 Tax=Amycolatopsis coloradensis TaxID=76021 RepID=A0A1R0KDL5_9PSEU|nr:sensor histidine kinase [Amycolatopsis coloradensis]OLZ43061.1 hypothetical protein BS329_40735 [Amycolatopsis coloradensis]